MQSVLEKEGAVVLRNMTWQSYTQIADSIQEQTRAYVTFDRGRLEIMTISRQHESLKKLVGMVFQALCDALGIDFAAGGSATLRRADLERGFEPDESYYVRRAAVVREMLLRESDQFAFPPPDLTIEVDLHSSSINRMDIFAAVGIAEVWRYEDDTLTIFLLDNDQYRVSHESVSVPGATPEMLEELITIASSESRKEFRYRVEEYAKELSNIN